MHGCSSLCIYAFSSRVFCTPHLSTRVCFPTLQPQSSAGTCARCVFSTPGGGVSAVLCWFPPQLFNLCLAYTSGKAQPAPLAPPTPPKWHKGQGLETEARAWPAPLPTCPRESSRAASAALWSDKAEEAPHILTKECACHREPRASIRIQLPELERPRHSHSPNVCHVGKWEKCNTSTWSIDRSWIGADAFPASEVTQRSKKKIRHLSYTSCTNLRLMPCPTQSRWYINFFSKYLGLHFVYFKAKTLQGLPEWRKTERTSLTVICQEPFHHQFSSRSSSLFCFWAN